MHDDWSRRDSTIHDVIIRNVKATSNLCWLVRLLAVETKIYNVIVDNVIDTAESPCHFGTVLLGEADFAYGVNRPDSIDNIVVSNVISNASLHAIGIRGCVSNSVINNVINKNPECKTLEVRNENALKNVTCSNIVTSENK